jgi:hypothetical protein
MAPSAMISPVIGHATCDLGQQQRLRAAALEGRIRSAAEPGHRLRLWRARSRARTDFAFDFGRSGEDVWRALRI